MKNASDFGMRNRTMQAHHFECHHSLNHDASCCKNIPLIIIKKHSLGFLKRITISGSLCYIKVKEVNAKLLKKHGYIQDGTLGLWVKGLLVRSRLLTLKNCRGKVAIKTIDQTKASAEILQKFLPRELEILPLLNHPHIIKTFKIFHLNEKKLFTVMELGMQENLLEFIKARSKLSEKLSKKLFRKFIHDKNIIHRDLKCENLLLDNDFNLKVADFGFSKRMEYMDGQTVLSDTFCGSSAYVSPELLQRISYNRKVNDVWSMGVVLFIMLTGTMSYNDTNIIKMLEKQKERAINLPKSVQDKYKYKYYACNLISCFLAPDPVRKIDINHILHHFWLQDEGTLGTWNSPSTSKAWA